jgi:hypothetical protein
MRRWNPRQSTAVALMAAGVVAVVGIHVAAQFGGMMFGFGNYPGGTLRTVFEMQRGTEDAPLRTYAIDIVPDSDGYHMTETIDAPLLMQGDIGSGLGRSGAAGTAGARYDEEGQRRDIDLTPLSALEERNVAIEANQNYYLPDGARLVTEDVVEIAGIEVVMGTFVHPSYPGQRVIMSFAAAEIEALLLFPVYMLREVDGEQDYLVQLVEFSHQL